MIPYEATLFLGLGLVGGGCISLLIATGLVACEVISIKQGAYLVGIALLTVIQIFLLMWLGNSFIGWLPIILVTGYIFLGFIFKNVRELITLGRVSLLDRRISCINKKGI